MILISRMHDPVTVLGYGERVGIWTQGCSIGCAGCISKDTWDFDQTAAMPVDDVLAWCESRLGEGRDGVTVSGGEPFDQPEPLADLIEGLRALIGGLDRPVDLLVYSGRPLRQLLREHADLLAGLDAVIAEPFMRNRPTDRPWIGSANQRLVPFSELGRKRYGSSDPAPPGQRLQVQVDEQGVWMIGVPRVGDMERVEAGLAARGVTLQEPSWRL